jgi:formylmethanofuran dehydrogenase subunit E
VAKKPQERVCQICAASFTAETRHPQQKYCSQRCNYRAWHERHHPPRPTLISCARCSAVIQVNEKNGRGGRLKYCSARCRAAAWVVKQGPGYRPNRHTGYYSPFPNRGPRKKHTYKRSAWRIHFKTCARCGKLFTTRRYGEKAQFCKSCRPEARKAHWRAYWQQEQNRERRRIAGREWLVRQVPKSVRNARRLLYDTRVALRQVEREAKSTAACRQCGERFTASSNQRYRARRNGENPVCPKCWPSYGRRLLREQRRRQIEARLCRLRGEDCPAGGPSQGTARG